MVSGTPRAHHQGSREKPRPSDFSKTEAMRESLDFLTEFALPFGI
jgi:hypothetical protein